ncbi:hypothetical protein, partial [Salinimicrobium oceani]
SGNQSVNNDAGECGAMVIVSANATDNCSVGAVGGTRDDGEALDALYPVGTTTITWTVTDVNDIAAAPINQTVTVTNEAPVINSISGPVDPVQVGTGVTLTADVTDTTRESATWRLITNGTVVDKYTYYCEECIDGNTVAGNFNPEPGV